MKSEKQVAVPAARHATLCAALAVAVLLVSSAPARAGQDRAGGPAAEPGTGTSGGTQAPQAGPKVVEEGLFPKSFKIPGTDLSLAVGGYVKVDFIQDFSSIGDAFEKTVIISTS